MSRAGLCLIATQPIARETEVVAGAGPDVRRGRRLRAAQDRRPGRLVHGAVRRLPDRRQVREDRRRTSQATWTCSSGSSTGRWPRAECSASHEDSGYPPLIRTADPDDPLRVLRFMQHAKQPPAFRARRQHQRVDLRMSAEIRTSETAFTATTRDLSEGAPASTRDRPLDGGRGGDRRPVPGARRRGEPTRRRCG